jgi:hypothetical protein
METYAGDVTGRSYEVDLERQGHVKRCLMFNPLKIDCANDHHPRHNLTVSYGTEARLVHLRPYSRSYCPSYIMPF